MDVVITYIDFTCVKWRKEYERSLMTRYDASIHTADSARKTRFVNHGELRFLLRSIAQNIDWVKRIFLVVDDSLKLPWLTGVTIVRHKELFGEYADCLPSFNPHAIETVLHRIPDISEPFLHFKDDMFVGRRIELEDIIDKKFAVFLTESPSKRGVPSTGTNGFRCAWMNVNRILDYTFGETLRYRLEHAPYVISPRVMEQLWEEFPTELLETLKSPFRSIYDINVSSALHPYYSLHTEDAFIQDDLKIKKIYLNINGFVKASLMPHFFCLGVGYPEGSDVSVSENDSDVIYKFLEKTFPDACSYEK